MAPRPANPRSAMTSVEKACKVGPRPFPADASSTLRCSASAHTAPQRHAVTALLRYLSVLLLCGCAAAVVHPLTVASDAWPTRARACSPGCGATGACAARAALRRMRGGCDPDTDVSSHVGDMTLGLPPPTPEAFEAFVDKREEELVTETRMLRKRYCDPATNKTTHVTRERWTWEEERAAACLHWLVVHAMRPPAEALWREAKLDGSGERQAPPADGPPVFLDLPRLLEESKVDARWDVKAALLGGDVADARRLVDSALGGAFLSEHSELLFEMLLQEFVEMVRAAHEAWVPPGKPGELGIADARGEGLERAVRFAQEELSLFCEANPSYNRMLEDALMVLTIDPRDAPVAGEGAERDKTDKSRLLFSPMRRMELFLLVNSAMLRHLGLDPQTGWEKMEVLTSWLQQEFGEEGWVRDLRGSLNDAGEEDRETRVAALIGRGGERFKDWWRVAPVSEAAFNASAVTRGVAAMQHMAAFMDRDDHPLTEEEEDALEKMRAVADEMAAGGDGDPDEVLGD